MAMVMARLALRNLQRKVNGSNNSSLTNKYWRSNHELVARFASAAGGGDDKGKSIVTQPAFGKGLAWRRNRNMLQKLDNYGGVHKGISALELFHKEYYRPGLGNSMKRIIWYVAPWTLEVIVHRKEEAGHDSPYDVKLKCDIPGISGISRAQEKIKRIIETPWPLKVEHKEEKENDNENWSSSDCLVLDDVKKYNDDIKAEWKDGVMTSMTIVPLIRKILLGEKDKIIIRRSLNNISSKETSK